jgi:hypothetical protein
VVKSFLGVPTLSSSISQQEKLIGAAASISFPEDYSGMRLQFSL